MKTRRTADSYVPFLVIFQISKYVFGVSFQSFPVPPKLILILEQIRHKHKTIRTNSFRCTTHNIPTVLCGETEERAQRSLKHSGKHYFELFLNCFVSPVSLQNLEMKLLLEEDI